MAAHRGDAEGGRESGGGGAGFSRLRWKIQGEPVPLAGKGPLFIPLHMQAAAAGGKGETCLLWFPLEQHLSSRQGGVPAEVHLAAGGEPAQVISPLVSQHEGRFREVVFPGDRLQQGVGEPCLQHAHRRWIAAEGTIGKGRQLFNRNLHGLSLPDLFRDAGGMQLNQCTLPEGDERHTAGTLS